jgi:hypothetical protein
MAWAPPLPQRFSTIKYMATSPLHFRAAVEKRLKTGTESLLRRGSVGHCLLYEPDKFHDRYVVWAGGGTRATKAYKEFAAHHEQQGLTVLQPSELAIGRGIVAGINAHPVAASLLSDSAAIVEQRIFWKDEASGIEMGGTPDYVSVRDGILLDLKTSGLDDHRFRSWAARAFYHAQAAIYTDGLAANGIEVSRRYWIMVEAAEPFDVIPYEVSDAAIDEGRTRYRGWLERIRGCTESGVWPGRAPEAVPFDLPEWAYLDREEPVTLTIGGEEMTI